MGDGGIPRRLWRLGRNLRSWAGVIFALSRKGGLRIKEAFTSSRASDGREMGV
jgi:hypothetical protein